MLYGVPAGEVDGVWGQISGFIEAARTANANADDLSLEQIHGELLSRDMQLWIWKVDGVIKAAAITKILSYHNKKVCSLPFIGGSAMRDWLHCQQLIESWARENGCDYLEGYARKGWLRVLKDWAEAYTVIRKRL